MTGIQKDRRCDVLWSSWICSVVIFSALHRSLGYQSGGYFPPWRIQIGTACVPITLRFESHNVDSYPEWTSCPTLVSLNQQTSLSSPRKNTYFLYHIFNHCKNVRLSLLREASTYIHTHKHACMHSSSCSGFQDYDWRLELTFLNYENQYR